MKNVSGLKAHELSEKAATKAIDVLMSQGQHGITELIDFLHHPSDGVVERAHATLLVITWQYLPPYASHWRQYLASSDKGKYNSQ